MASKKLERLFLDRMLKDLGWAAAQVLDGDEPPDFYVMTDAGRVSVEVTRIYRREHPKKGSPEAAQEREFEQFVRSLAHEYFTGEAAQAIQMSVALPPIIRSPKGEAVVAERETVGRSGGSREGTREVAAPAEIGSLGAAQIPSTSVRRAACYVPCAWPSRWDWLGTTLGRDEQHRGLGRRLGWATPPAKDQRQSSGSAQVPADGSRRRSCSSWRTEVGHRAS